MWQEVPKKSLLFFLEKNIKFIQTRMMCNQISYDLNMDGAHDTLLCGKINLQNLSTLVKPSWWTVPRSLGDRGKKKSGNGKNPPSISIDFLTTHGYSIPAALIIVEPSYLFYPTEPSVGWWKIMVYFPCLMLNRLTPDLWWSNGRFLWSSARPLKPKLQKKVPGRPSHLCWTTIPMNHHVSWKNNHFSGWPI